MSSSPPPPVRNSTEYSVGWAGGMAAALGFGMLGIGSAQPVLKDTFLSGGTLNTGRVWMLIGGDALLFIGTLCLLVPVIATAIRAARQ
jgi:F0F1-type ATP synthase assembly protein I